MVIRKLFNGKVADKAIFEAAKQFDDAADEFTKTHPTWAEKQTLKPKIKKEGRVRLRVNPETKIKFEEVIFFILHVVSFVFWRNNHFI